MISFIVSGNLQTHDMTTTTTIAMMMTTTMVTMMKMTMSLTMVSTLHYNDVIMSAFATQITSVSIVCSTVGSGADKKHKKNRVTGLCLGNLPVAGEFPAQKASNAGNVSIWWRHVGLRWLRYDYDQSLLQISANHDSHDLYIININNTKSYDYHNVMR